jgi:hypothetical protein
MAADATVRAIADELAARYGGREALGLSGCSVVFQIASLLAGGLDAAGARTVAALREMLPPPVAPKVPAPGLWDVASLDDHDFGNVMSAACHAFGGERVVGDDGVIRIPALSITAETLERIERVIVENERLRSEVSRATAALEAARAALEGRNLAALQDAVRSDPASMGSARGPRADVVVPLRPRTPQESPDCAPLEATSNYDHLGIGSSSGRFDNSPFGGAA